MQLQRVLTVPSLLSIQPYSFRSESSLRYSCVGGLFLQDLPSTDPAVFDYTATNFGLIEQSYTTDELQSTRNLSQWQRFDRLLQTMNQESPQQITYKLLFIGRHGEGYHNVAESRFGTPAWNCYYGQFEGDSNMVWADAHLTPNGVGEAIKANRFLQHELLEQRMRPPGSYYVSPLFRCLETAFHTFHNLSLPVDRPFAPLIKELFREGISIRTCDRRSRLSLLRETFPGFRPDPSMTEHDELWSGLFSETQAGQDHRTKLALDEVFSSDFNSVVSITSHSGEAAALLRVLSHREFWLRTGSIIPVLVKAESVRGHGATTTSMSKAPASWCTNRPPMSSGTLAAGQCVCSDGVVPTTALA